MTRMKLLGYAEKSKETINAENSNRMTVRRGTIDAKYIRKEKIKEMEEYGYAYVNQPKERLV